MNGTVGPNLTVFTHNPDIIPLIKMIIVYSSRIGTNCKYTTSYKTVTRMIFLSSPIFISLQAIKLLMAI